VGSKVPVVDTEVDPPQQNSISRESDDEPQKKPFSLAGSSAKSVGSLWFGQLSKLM